LAISPKLMGVRHPPAAATSPGQVFNAHHTASVTSPSVFVQFFLPSHQRQTKIFQRNSCFRQIRKPPLVIFTSSPHASTPKYSQGRSSDFRLHQVSIFVARTILLCETNSFPFVFGLELVNHSPLHADIHTQFNLIIHWINGDKQGLLKKWKTGE
jgi:hypothetical protein